MQLAAFIAALAAIIAFLVAAVPAKSYTAYGLALLTLAVIIQLVWTTGTTVHLG